MTETEPIRCAVAVVLAVVCLSLLPGCAGMDKAEPPVFISPGATASESTAEIPAEEAAQPAAAEAAEPTASAELPVTGGATKGAASSRRQATPSTPHNESAGATAAAHDPAYVMDGVCTPLAQNGAPQTLTLAISLYMDADQIWKYVETIETACKTAQRKEGGRIVQAGTLKNYDPQYVKLRADIDCGDPAVLKCALQNGRTQIVDVTDSNTVPMLWRWNVQALSAKPFGEKRVLSVLVSGARKDGEFKPIDSIPDARISIDIDPIGIIKYIRDSSDGLKAMLLAIAGVIGVVVGWFKVVRPKRSST